MRASRHSRARDAFERSRPCARGETRPRERIAGESPGTRVRRVRRARSRTMESDFGWELDEEDIRDEPTFDDEEHDEAEHDADEREEDDGDSHPALASTDDGPSTTTSRARVPRAGTRASSRRDGFEPTPTPAMLRCADALADEDDDEDEWSMDARRDARARSTTRRAKRRRRDVGGSRSRADAATAFARRVLGWTVDGLRAGTRQAVGEGPMPRAMTTYESLDAWYATQEELVYEEARATLAAAASTSARSTAFDVDASVVEDVEDGELMTILASPKSVVVSDDWRKPATAILLWRVDARGRVERETLALVAAIRHETTTRETVVPLIVRASTVFRDAFASTVTFRATPLESLITHRRMAVACFIRPRVAFAAGVLGRGRAKHTKFIHSDDEEEDARDERTDETHGADRSTEPAFALALNASQRDAAKSFVDARGDADRLRAVIGPPGTGKTRFAASLLAHLVATNHRVLVCAPSNKAVCVVMEAYLNATRRRDVVEDEDRDIVALVGVEEALRDAATEASTMARFVYHACDVVARRMKETLEAYRRGDVDADDARRAGERARRFLRRRAPDFLAGDVEAALDALRRAADADVRDAGARAAAAIFRGSGRGDRGDEFARETIRRARVTFCTLASAGQSVMAALDGPDVLLVDEAAQALEPELAVAFARHPRRALLIGDPAQLPASLTSEVARRGGHATSLMERLVMNDAEAARALNAQYRMHPEISSWPAREFYDGGVMNAPNVETRARPKGTPRWLPPYVFVDVPDGVERGGRGKSKSNEREVQVACDVVARIRGDNDDANALSIVVITFYAAQVGRLREALASRGLRDVAARSVDSFQGSEADVVVCSAVRNNARFNVGFLADRRRLNVALTRAKHALVMVGSRDTLAKCDAEGLRRLVEDVERRRLIISDRDIASSWR